MEGGRHPNSAIAVTTAHGEGARGCRREGSSICSVLLHLAPIGPSQQGGTPGLEAVFPEWPLLRGGAPTTL